MEGRGGRGGRGEGGKGGRRGWRAVKCNSVFVATLSQRECVAATVTSAGEQVCTVQG